MQYKKLEFTKITLPDGRINYISKNRPDHDALIARLMEDVRPDIQAASKDQSMEIRVDS